MAKRMIVVVVIVAGVLLTTWFILGDRVIRTKPIDGGLTQEVNPIVEKSQPVDTKVNVVVTAPVVRSPLRAEFVKEMRAKAIYSITTVRS